MRRIASLGLFALAVLTLPLAFNAQAAPADTGTAIVSPSDAGLIPDAVTLSKNTNYEIQCKNPSCARFYRYDAGTQVADCTVAGVGFQLPTVNNTATASTNTVPGASYKFQSGALDRLRVAALDGGQPRCVLYLDTQNL